MVMVTYFGNKFSKCSRILSSTNKFFHYMPLYIKVKTLTMMNGKRQKVGHDELIYN